MSLLAWRPRQSAGRGNAAAELECAGFMLLLIRSAQGRYVYLDGRLAIESAVGSDEGDGDGRHLTATSWGGGVSPTFEQTKPLYIYKCRGAAALVSTLGAEEGLNRFF